ncbi:MAG: hypothetical protein LBI35_04395 [Burkholderiales bacterium]|jgi:hypothetical protein|nr:hypothetical protein [Burkholderiales bacterium]
MKEYPIIFSDEMVRAILDGRKTQTRRVIRPQPADGIRPYIFSNDKVQGWVSSLKHKHGNSTVHICPYGQAGDGLWVRESWQAWKEFDDTKAKDLPEEMRLRINYTADGNIWDAKKRRSIHMPRCASRILLEITDVRVQRVQDISENDCWSEGIDAVDGALDDLKIYEMAKRMNCSFEEARPTFAVLWDTINAKRGYGWDANPWVWAITFKRI